MEFPAELNADRFRFKKESAFYSYTKSPFFNKNAFQYDVYRPM